MPYTKIIIHLIWSTKNRQKLINKELKEDLLKHIRENCKTKNIYLDAINCVSDHIHIIVILHPDQQLSKVVQLIKGESSHWINKNKFLKIKFAWQSEYMAISVSESNLNKVRKYIENQEEHHRIKSYAEEYNQFLEKSGLKNLALAPAFMPEI